MSRLRLLKQTANYTLANLRLQQQQSSCLWSAVAMPTYSDNPKNSKISCTIRCNNKCFETTNSGSLRDVKRQLWRTTYNAGKCPFDSLFSTQTSQSNWSANIGSISREFGTKSSPDRAGKSDTKASAAIAEADIFGESSKLGLIAKFKLMYKQYWYVLIPVHVITSLSWVGAFYYMSKSGVDIGGLLQHLHLSDAIIAKVRNSNMGHYAIAYLCYKIVTPIRYAVTVGVTTVSIKHLVQKGYIKPIPSKKQLMRMYEQKKASRAAAKAAGKDND